MQITTLYKEKLFAGLMVLVSAAVTVQAYSYDPESSHFPHFLSWCLVFFSALNVVRVLRTRGATSIAREELERALCWLRLAAGVFFLLVAYLAGIQLAGFYPTTALFLALFIRLQDRERVLGARTILTVTVCFVAAVWLLFGLFLGTNMPMGMVFELIAG